MHKGVLTTGLALLVELAVAQQGSNKELISISTDNNLYQKMVALAMYAQDHGVEMSLQNKPSFAADFSIDSTEFTTGNRIVINYLDNNLASPNLKEGDQITYAVFDDTMIRNVARMYKFTDGKFKLLNNGVNKMTSNWDDVSMDKFYTTLKQARLESAARAGTQANALKSLPSRQHGKRGKKKN